MVRLKKTIIGAGICIGSLSAILAMVPTSQNAEASVLVIDKQNIEEAIKTAINTASILTNEQKQLALQILNMKTLDSSTLQALINSQTGQQNTILNEHDEILGALEKNNSVPAFWKQELGSVESVLNGNETLYDFYMNSQKRAQALDKTNESAAEAAKNAQIFNENLMKNTSTALSESNNAEGNLQAIQAGNAIAAQQTAAIINGNELLAHQTAIQATNLQQQNMDRTEGMQMEKNAQDVTSEWANSITDADRSQ
ncbi:hypothetical protein [Pectinatus frisingensis]|uniref:hypothetical protein n=1 Tax=Pectinatus frisingensis TaxID=865 RepID=UPI003D8092F4